MGHGAIRPGHKYLAFALALGIAPLAAGAERLANEQAIALWPDPPASAPAGLVPKIVDRSPTPFRAERELTGITEPSLTVYLPQRPTGTAMIVAPGGSYRWLTLDRGGAEIAPLLTADGITVFLLAYRLPGEGHEGAPDVPLADGQRAVRLVRAHAAEWRLDPHRIGFLGFSAGGHLGASLATGFGRAVYAPLDAADRLPARPDFVALVYPVITMLDGAAHEGSREALLGESPSETDKRTYSPQLHVTPRTPATFMVLADDDTTVDAENAVGFYGALHDAGVTAELHIFRDGGHSFGIRGAAGLPVEIWPALMTAWMERIGMLNGGEK